MINNNEIDNTNNKRRKNNDNILNQYELRIIIIGGGLCGLSTALSLQSKGFKNITIYEKDLHFNDRKQGYGLTLSNYHNCPLQLLNIIDECFENDCLSTCHYIFNPNGNILGYYGRAFTDKSNEKPCNNHHRFNLRIPRQTLRQIIYDRLDFNNVIINWGYKLIDYNEDNDITKPIELQFINSSNEIELIQSDLVIGCDGIYSITRQLYETKLYNNQLISSINTLQYIGITVIIGLSSYYHPLIDKQGFYTLDGINRFFIMPFKSFDNNKQNGLTMWQLSFSNLNENEAKNLKNLKKFELLNFLIEKTKTYFELIHKLIEYSNLDDIWCTPIYDRPIIQSQYKLYNKVLLLGDSLHPMSMFKGQGANQSLLDSITLAKYLSKDITSYKQLNTLINHCYREIYQRVSKKVEMSRNAASYLHNEKILNEKFFIDGLNEVLVNKLNDYLMTNRLNIDKIINNIKSDIKLEIVDSELDINTDNQLVRLDSNIDSKDFDNYLINIINQLKQNI